jgi:hypothetical protein
MSQEKKDRYAIIVAEHVSGKSKGPVGFSRVKPIKYRQAKYAHPIVYYKKYLFESQDDAIQAAKDVSKEMFKLYSMNLGSNFTRVMDYSIVLHNISDDEAQTIYSSMPHIKEVNGKLYDHHYEGRDFIAKCDNKTLASWKVIYRRYGRKEYE